MSFFITNDQEQKEQPEEPRKKRSKRRYTLDDGGYLRKQSPFFE